jgi:hypothetical protein
MIATIGIIVEDVRKPEAETPVIGPHPLHDMPAPAENSGLAVLVRMATDYDTQIADPDNSFKFVGVHLQEGDEILVDYEKARTWTHRGIAQVVEFFLPWEPPEPVVPPHFCYLHNLRNYAIIMKYGLGGWIDPIELSAHDNVGLPVCLVMKGLDHLGYERYERSGGGVGYRQKRAGAPGRAEA